MSIVLKSLTNSIYKIMELMGYAILIYKIGINAYIHSKKKDSKIKVNQVHDLKFKFAETMNPV